MVEFSLERGVMRTWHEFLTPLDSVPEGYKYRCLKHARVTHNLTSEFEYYKTHYRVFMESLIQFLGGTNEGKLPPLYVLAHHMDAAECITEFIIEQSNAQVPLRVFSLPKLMMELHNLPLENVSPDEAYPNEFVAQIILNYWKRKVLVSHWTRLSVPRVLGELITLFSSNLSQARVQLDSHL